jgi:hypothetical protein
VVSLLTNPLFDLSVVYTRALSPAEVQYATWGVFGTKKGLQLDLRFEYPFPDTPTILDYSGLGNHATIVPPAFTQFPTAIEHCTSKATARCRLVAALALGSVQSQLLVVLVRQRGVGQQGGFGRFT